MHGRRLPRLLLANLSTWERQSKAVTIAGAEKVPAENLDEDKSGRKDGQCWRNPLGQKTVSTPEKSPPGQACCGGTQAPSQYEGESIPADGNCLFEALAQSLGGKTARNVRASVVTH